MLGWRLGKLREFLLDDFFFLLLVHYLSALFKYYYLSVEVKTHGLKAQSIGELKWDKVIWVSFFWITVRPFSLTM